MSTSTSSSSTLLSKQNFCKQSSLNQLNMSDLPNVASPLLGAKVLFATDEWFAAADNVVKDEDPVWLQDEYTPFGKWMDGWESRRRRTEGHDWSIIELGMSAIIKTIEIDTAYFTGNFSPKVSVYGVNLSQDNWEISALKLTREESVKLRPEHKRMGLCASEKEWEIVSSLDSEDWDVLVPLSPLGAGYEETRKNVFQVQHSSPVSHIRLNMGPDGGIARIRVYGEVVVRPENIPRDRDVDLAAVEFGGLALACSNKHYGHPRNLIVPGRGNCMGDGWETARQPLRPAVYRKGPDGLMELPGFEWALLQLGLRGVVSALEIDTHFYKGNYPESCMVEGCYLPKGTSNSVLLESDSDDSDGLYYGDGSDSAVDWKVLLPRTRLTSDAKHFFSVQDRSVNNLAALSHIRITMYPDGGIMRVRVLGRPEPAHERSRL